MNTFINTVGPVIGKLVLGYFFGPTVATIGGTVLNLSAKRFTDAQAARKAAGFAEEFGNSIARQIDTSLIGEGASDVERAFVGRELSSMLDQAPLAKLVVSSSMNVKKLNNSLKSIGNPIALNSREIGFFQFAIRATASQLRKLGPAIKGYDVERDEVVLTALEKLAADSEELVQGQKEIELVLSGISDDIDVLISDEQRKFDAYENEYISKISELLNYVEVLGLEDIKRDRRESNLEVAYLSLSLSGSNKLPSDFASFLYHLIRTNGRAIIQGGAGSGKSTLLRWAAVKARHIDNYAPTFRLQVNTNDLVKLRSNLSSKKIRDYELITKGLSGRRIIWENMHAINKFQNVPLEIEPGSFLDIANTLARVPFLIRLRSINGKLPTIDELPMSLSPVLGKPPAGWISNCLNDGRAVLMFDGIDEVPQGAKRDNILREIAEFSITYPHAAILVTTRPHAFNLEKSGLENFQIATVDELNVEQQTTFVKNWHIARAANTPADQKDIHQSDAAALIKRFELSPVLARLATNPLLCAAICALHEFDRDTLPEDERTLCSKLTEMLVYKRDQTSGRDNAIDIAQFGAAYMLPYEKKKTLLATLAASMLRSGISQLSMEDAIRLMTNALKEIGEGDIKPGNAIGALVARSGVLRGSSIAAATKLEGSKVGTEINLPDGVEFIHNRFKEWLGSTYFLSHGTVDELIKRAHEDGFGETCTFAAAAPDQKVFVSRLIDGLLKRTQQEQHRATKRTLQILVVKCALIAQSLPIATRNQIDELSRKLLPPKSMDEAKALADLGDLAIGKIRWRNNRNIRESVYCIRCLSYINTPKAKAALFNYRADTRWTVADELSRHIEPLNIPKVAAEVSRGTVERSSTTFFEKIKLRIRNIPNDVFSEDNTMEIDLSHSGVKDIEALSKLSKLVELNLNFSKVNNIDALTKLHKLEALRILGCEIPKFNSMSNLKKVEFLSIGPVNIDNVSVISDFKNLTYLFARECKSKNLKFVSQLDKICSITILDSDLTELDGIENLSKMDQLVVEDCPLSDITAISGNDQLEEVYFKNTQICNIESLSKLSRLKHLSLRGNPIKSILEISELEGLEYLDIGQTQIEEINALINLENLTTIGLDGVEIDNIEVFSKLPNLERIFLGSTNVNDITPLSELKKLNHLVLPIRMKELVKKTSFASNIDEILFFNTNPN